MQITKKIVDEMMSEMDEILKKLGAKYGLEISCNGASYNSTSIDFKVRAEDAQANWNYFITGTRLKPEDFGREVALGGKTMKIRGWDYKAKTNKVRLVECSTGQIYCAPVNAVADALNRNTTDNAVDPTLSVELDEAAKKRQFETLAWYIGLGGKVEYGQVVQADGMELKLVEINRRAPKFPLIGQDVKTGKKYKLPVSIIE